jgi:hypothetical protein
VLRRDSTGEEMQEMVNCISDAAINHCGGSLRERDALAGRACPCR